MTIASDHFGRIEKCGLSYARIMNQPNGDRPTLLFLTDLNYQAAGRDYHNEDILLTGALKDTFDIIISDPRSSGPFEAHVDGIVIRNSGPITNYLIEFEAFKKRINQFDLKTFNSLDGKADINGKYYLPSLFKHGFKVIPSITDPKEIDLLPDVQTFVVKPMMGADSIGLRLVQREEIEPLMANEFVIQPKLDIEEEHSLFFLDNEFCYALKTVNERWEMIPFDPKEKEIRLASTFIEWNQMDTGIQRVDFAQTSAGLLLVELEDINPFLSLELLDASTRQHFIVRVKKSLLHLID